MGWHEQGKPHSLWRLGEQIVNENMPAQPVKYVRYSHLTFHAGQYVDAARRFLELRQELGREEEYDEERHYEEFVRCDSCEGVGELREQYTQFAIHFAYVWALKLVESVPKKAPGTVSSQGESRGLSCTPKAART
jgi:hypothetical protein